MNTGSSARLVIDSVLYLEKVEKMNRGTTFFELRDRITNDWIDIFKYLATGRNFENAYSNIHRILQHNKTTQVIPYPLLNVKRAPNIVDLSGKKFSVYYTMNVDRAGKALNHIEEMSLAYQFDALRNNTLNPLNFDFISALTSGASAGRISKNEFTFSITLRNMNPTLLIKGFALLGRLGMNKNTERSIRSNTTHELIHVLDPRRNRSRKTYDVHNIKAYTDHIIERASKLQDAFGEKFEGLRKDIESGNMSNVLLEKVEFNKNPQILKGFIYSKGKYQYVDKFIKENVSADWSSSLTKRIKFAPGLYHYAIKAVSKFFDRAEWDRVPAFADKVVEKIRKLRLNDLNGYYVQKMQFTTNPGFYIDSILKGTSIVGSTPDFKSMIVTNTDIFNMFFKRLNEEAFYD